jgi:hypothetical protein
MMDRGDLRAKTLFRSQRPVQNYVELFHNHQAYDNLALCIAWEVSEETC